MVGACSMHGGDKQIKGYKMFNIWRVATTLRTMSKWDNIIKTDYKWIGWEILDRIDFAQNRTKCCKQILIKCNIERFLEKLQRELNFN